MVISLHLESTLERILRKVSYKDYDHPRTMTPQTPPPVYFSIPGWTPSGPPQEQARALLQRLEALVPGLKRDLKALPELKRTQELQRLCRLWGFPQVLLGELQELLAPQEQQEKTGTKAQAQHDKANNQSLEATT